MSPLHVRGRHGRWRTRGALQLVALQGSATARQIQLQVAGMVAVGLGLIAGWDIDGSGCQQPATDASGRGSAFKTERGSVTDGPLTEQDNEP